MTIAFRAGKFKWKHFSWAMVLGVLPLNVPNLDFDHPPLLKKRWSWQATFVEEELELAATNVEEKLEMWHHPCL